MRAAIVPYRARQIFAGVGGLRIGDNGGGARASVLLRFAIAGKAAMGRFPQPLTGQSGLFAERVPLTRCRRAGESRRAHVGVIHERAGNELTGTGS